MAQEGSAQDKRGRHCISGVGVGRGWGGSRGLPSSTAGSGLQMWISQQRRASAGCWRPSCRSIFLVERRNKEPWPRCGRALGLTGFGALRGVFRPASLKLGRFWRRRGKKSGDWKATRSVSGEWACASRQHTFSALPWGLWKGGAGLGTSQQKDRRTDRQLV